MVGVALQGHDEHDLAQLGLLLLEHHVDHERHREQVRDHDEHPERLLLSPLVSSPSQHCVVRWMLLATGPLTASLLSSLHNRAR